MGRLLIVAAALLLLVLGGRAWAQGAAPPVHLPMVVAPPGPTATPAPTMPAPKPIPEPWRLPDTAWVQLEVVNVEPDHDGVLLSVHNQTDRAMGTVAVTRVLLNPDGSIGSELAQRYASRLVAGQTRRHLLMATLPDPAAGRFEAWGLPVTP